MRALLFPALLVITSCTPEASPVTTAGPLLQPTVPPTPVAATPTAPSATAVPVSIEGQDLKLRVRSVVPRGWQPPSAAAYLAWQIDQTTQAVIAVPLDAADGPVTEVVRFSAVRDWNVRADGAIVASLLTSPGTLRLAIWDPSTGDARWITGDDGLLPQDVLWSYDGASVYYGLAPHTCDSPCFSMHELKLDGSEPRRIRGPSEQFGSPQFVTPDGRAIVWSRGQQGGSVDVLQVGSGKNTPFPGGGGATSEEGWREARPRALVLLGTCCAGMPLGELVLWDDIGGTVRTLIAREPERIGTVNAVWDPDGKRIAITAMEPLSNGEFRVSIALTDPTGRPAVKLAETDGHWVLAWVRAGIVATRTRDSVSELVLVSPETGASRLLFRLGDAQLVQVIGD